MSNNIIYNISLQLASYSCYCSSICKHNSTAEIIHDHDDATADDDK